MGELDLWNTTTNVKKKKTDVKYIIVSFLRFSWWVRCQWPNQGDFPFPIHFQKGKHGRRTRTWWAEGMNRKKIFFLCLAIPATIKKTVRFFIDWNALIYYLLKDNSNSNAYFITSILQKSLCTMKKILVFEFSKTFISKYMLLLGIFPQTKY